MKVSGGPARGALTLLTVMAVLLLSLMQAGEVGGQAGADVDMGAEQDTDPSNDMDQSNLNDPSLVNPINKEGYGRNVQTQLIPSPPKGRGKKGQTTTKPSVVEKNLGEQTVQAALQFGVLVAVALMVGILFMLNIGAELCFDAIVEKVCDMFGSKGEPDIENQDPAAIVGTFKRYK